MPPKKQCTLAFMRDIMFGNKKVFHTKQIHMVNVPSHEELALKHVLEEIKEIPRFVEYLPNLTGGKVNVCKQFIFNVSCNLI